MHSHLIFLLQAVPHQTYACVNPQQISPLLRQNFPSIELIINLDAEISSDLWKQRPVNCELGG